MLEKSIIFFDIDGTLLDDNKDLPTSAEQAIRQLKELGHEVVIATGRAPFMCKDIRDQLGIDTFVCYNGSYVVVKGEVIYSHPLDKDALHNMTELALRHNHAVVYMSGDTMKASVPDHEFVAQTLNTFKLKYLPEHDPLYYRGRDIYQSLLMCQANEETFYETICPDFDFVRWHRYSVDVIPAGGSKAIGIRKIIEKLPFSPEQQYCFGDGLNDLQMLTIIPNSVAMGNGVPEAKAAAKYVTRPVDEDGILHGLQMVGLLK